MLVPLYGFLKGDTVGLVILIHDHQRVSEIADKLQQAASVRVAPGRHPQVYFRGERLDPNSTVGAAGLTALDRIDVIAEKR